MGDADTWLTAVKLVGGALAALLIALAGLVTGKRSGAGSSAVEGDVVAASFTERAQLERLIGILSAVNETLLSNNDCNRKMLALMEADAHRREVAAEVELELRKRGVER